MRASWWAGESGRSGGSWCLWTSRRRWRAEAGRWGAELIVSHHPVIFHPVKALTDQTSTGRTLLLLAEQGIGAVCAHTNLDAAQGGVNDCLARPWSWTVWNCSAGTGLTDRGGPTASAGLDGPSGRLFRR